MGTLNIWVLTDHKTGSNNQAIDLANYLQMPFVIQHIEYNSFSILPNMFLQFFPFHVKKNILLDIKQAIAPDVIISAGRRTALLAIYIKKLSNHNVKIIQIMNPKLDMRYFDLMILPKHDQYQLNSSKVISITGTITNIQHRITNARSNLYQELAQHYPGLIANEFISVIIGGSTKDYKFSLQDAKLLGDRIKLIAKNHNLPLFISFSRRTPEIVREYFKDNFRAPNVIYDCHTGNLTPNPYLIMLSNAKYIICTSDSISICTEAASVQKPLYIFSPLGLTSKKHNLFINELFQYGVAKLLDHTVQFLEEYRCTPLNEIVKIKDKISQIISKKAKIRTVS